MNDNNGLERAARVIEQRCGHWLGARLARAIRELKEPETNYAAILPSEGRMPVDGTPPADAKP